MRRPVTLGRIMRATLAIVVATLSLRKYTPTNRRVFRALRDKFANFDHTDYVRSLRTLERAGLVRVAGDGQRLIPTRAGQREAIARGLGLQKLPVPTSWDGTWCVVSFDVPRTASKRRDCLRACLRGIGFEPVNQSVFAHPGDGTEAVGEIAVLLGASRYMTLMTGCTIENDRTLRRKFFR
ncbi:MAG TPA: hypothetical protein VJJ47_02745 [Candidatus Paceibacterota bacterium]